MKVWHFFPPVALTSEKVWEVYASRCVSVAPHYRTWAPPIRPYILLLSKSSRCRTSWISHELLLSDFLMIAGLGLLYTSRLSTCSSLLMNEKKQKKVGKSHNLDLDWSQKVFFMCLNLHRRHKTQQPPCSSERMMYGPSTKNTALTKSRLPNGTVLNIHTLLTDWHAEWKIAFMFRPPVPAKRLRFRIKRPLLFLSAGLLLIPVLSHLIDVRFLRLHSH